MPGDTELPNIKVGRDADRDEDKPEETSTVKYLNYEVLDEHGWTTDDEDLFKKAAKADLSAADFGTFEAGAHRYILDAAEDRSHEWPFECRAASCANCAAILANGEVEMDMDLILTEEEVEEKRIILTCQALAVSDEVEIVYNAQHLDYLQDRVIGVRDV
ncbi:ferredoxin Fer [Halegenticoccus tardaugens]|uniref:ferredoxin Fer n=1 Tax=Halegenticoccus tardaugens TaxID=2071624 RepID=UPI00100B8F3D|nr:ferredoxin Fer [Halegenticoccus tardaugens]